MGKHRLPQANLLKAGILFFTSNLHGQMLNKKLEGLEISTIILTQVQDKKSQGIWAASSKGFNHSHCPINFDVIHPVRLETQSLGMES